MNIVVLDGHTLNPGDLSWDPILGIGEVSIYPRTDPGEILDRAAGADALLVNKIVLTREIINQLPRLKYIGLMATGFDNVDFRAAAEKGIIVTNVPSYSTPAVAQHTFALILQLSNCVGLHDRSVHDQDWVRSADFSYFLKPLSELGGKTIGLIGYGKISKVVETIAHAFDMNILIFSNHADSCKFGRLVPLEKLCAESDIISLHTSLTDQNRGMVNKSMIDKMKKGCWLINTSRGALLNEEDVARALEEGRIGAAGLDVLGSEPPYPENPLLAAPNCIITPHISWASRESRQRLMNVLAENLSSFIKGEFRNRIN